MAKVNGIMNGATGKLGGNTYYRANGKTIVRELSSKVKNPQTFAQMIQRVFVKTCAAQYSALQAIADHSFEGYSMGANCMSRFQSLNLNMFRERAAELQRHGASIYDFYQFMFVGQQKYTPAPVILSTGKLPRVITQIAPNGSMAQVTYNDSSTYGAIINSLGLKRGDQLTFVTIEKDIVTNEYVVNYARVILDPRNLDGTPAPLTTSFAANNAPVDPNMRNRGTFSLLETIAPGILQFKLGSGQIAAAGVIVSRKGKNGWMRSYCKLIMNENVLGDDLLSLGAAVDASVTTDEIYTDSDEYLNNAGIGGPQGSVSSAPTPSLAPEVSNIVLINGVQQDVSGGAVRVSTLTGLVVNGVRLADGTVTITKTGDDPISLVANDDGTQASISMSGPIVNTDTDYVVKLSGSPWFVITLEGVNGGME